MKNIQSELTKKNTLAAWVFILPALIGTLIFIIIPIFFSFSLSFFEWDLLSNMQFVGLQNYKNILTDATFIQIIINTFVFAIFIIPPLPLYQYSIISSNYEIILFTNKHSCYNRDRGEFYE